MERRGSNGSHNKPTEPWSFGGGGRETISSSQLGGFSWTPRSYICSFCKREFKSAQALGGHMNIHRRDRARLRAESLPQLTFKPYFTTCFSSSPTYNTSSSAEHCSLESRSPKVRKAMKALFEFGDLKGFIKEDENTKCRKREAMTLDLKIGVLSCDLKEDLDLELRLGYSV